MAFSMMTSQGVGAACIPDALDALPSDAQLVVLVCSVVVDRGELMAHARRRFPGAALHAATSCLGAMTEAGVHLGDGVVMAVAFSDPDGSYGTAVGSAGDGSLSALAATLLERAQLQADRPGEQPGLVWVSAAPGTEESVIGALDSLLGGQVPIYGGSSADNDISGRWWVADGQETAPGGVLLSVLYPEADVLHAFHSGYEPAGVLGRVTASEGRTLSGIDGRPAAQVYNEHTGGAMDAYLSGGNVLGASTLYPLAIVVGEVNGVPYHRLIHPETIQADGALTLFAEAPGGAEVVLMRGDEQSLLTRAGRVAEAALALDGGGLEDVVGGLVTYCAGCMLAVQDNIDAAHASLTGALPGVPFLGQFTFGEQGTFPNGESCHGNLMISTVLFRALA